MILETESIGKEIEQDLREHGFSKVRRVVVEYGDDSTGDAAFFIWVLLDDKVPNKKLTWDELRPMFEHVQQYVRARYEDVWPYVRARRLREWAELSDVLV